MKKIVITGSTRGIGFGLANEFLALGCGVTISGRSGDVVGQAVTRLKEKFPNAELLGVPCDVRRFEQVQALWDAAKAHFGDIDIWINNAGIANPVAAFWEQSPEQVSDIIQTNLIGAMNGAIVALNGMIAQGFGAVYNLEGLGSGGGRKVFGLIPYGTSKAAMRYLDDALAEEVKGKPVIVGAIQPGMTATDMIRSQYRKNPEDFEKVKPILNLISDRVENVAPWIARRVLANTKNGARISYVSMVKIMGRFLMAPFRKRNVYD